MGRITEREVSVRGRRCFYRRLQGRDVRWFYKVEFTEFSQLNGGGGGVLGGLCVTKTTADATEVGGGQGWIYYKS
jgi:hypothetical protein